MKSEKVFCKALPYFFIIRKYNVMCVCYDRKSVIDKICGYCIVAITEFIPDLHYTPYIGYLFIGEKRRGNGLSQKLIIYSMSYLKSVGFDKVYLLSDHENLHQKYDVIGRKTSPLGSEEKIYYQKIQ